MIKTDRVHLMFGDCLERMKEIPDGSVDMILTDPPYGTVKGISGVDHGLSGKTEWDTVLDQKEMMTHANRILRKNGKMVLTAQQPFTNTLINSAIPNLPFNYSMIWEKDHFANALLAKKAPVSYYEDILVFSKTHDLNRAHPLIPYFIEELYKTGLNQAGVNALLGNRMGSHYFTNGVQFCIPTEQNYLKLQETGFFRKSYKEIKEIDLDFKSRYPSVFNIPEGERYKSNILKYKKDYDGYHPTQKPISLMIDLILTFSRREDMILDFTMGSGSTGVAAMQTNRKFIGIELDPGYFATACQRILASSDQS